VKIGQYLAKILSKYDSLLFLGHPVYAYDKINTQYAKTCDKSYACVRTCENREPDTSATRYFGIKTVWDTSAPQNRCRSLSRITGRAVSHRNCPGSKCPGFSSITALVSKCLVPRIGCRSVLRPVPKCPSPRVSLCRSVLWWSGYREKLHHVEMARKRSTGQETARGSRQSL